MVVFGAKIDTPYDPGYPDYHTHWRQLITQSCIDAGEQFNFDSLPDHIRKDPWLLSYAQYRTNYNEDDYISPDNEVFDIARADKWKTKPGNTSTRHIVEALLLGGATYEMIAKHLDSRGQVTPGQVEIYCKLFFDVTESDGSLKQRCWDRCRAALPLDINDLRQLPEPNYMKSVSWYLGYYGLLRVLRMIGFDDEKVNKDPIFRSNEILIVMQSMLMGRILRGNFNLEAAVGIMNNILESGRLELEQRFASDEQPVDTFLEAMSTLRIETVRNTAKLVDQELSLDSAKEKFHGQLLQLSAPSDSVNRVKGEKDVMEIIKSGLAGSIR